MKGKTSTPSLPKSSIMQMPAPANKPAVKPMKKSAKKSLMSKKAC